MVLKVRKRFLGEQQGHDAENEEEQVVEEPHASVLETRDVLLVVEGFERGLVADFGDAAENAYLGALGERSEGAEDGSKVVDGGSDGTDEAVDVRDDVVFDPRDRDYSRYGQRDGEGFPVGVVGERAVGIEHVAEAGLGEGGKRGDAGERADALGNAGNRHAAGSERAEVRDIERRIDGRGSRVRDGAENGRVVGILFAGLDAAVVAVLVTGGGRAAGLFGIPKALGLSRGTFVAGHVASVLDGAGGILRGVRYFREAGVGVDGTEMPAGILAAERTGDGAPSA